MTRPLVFLFPGQSSRDPGMFDRIAAVAPDVAADALTVLGAYDVDPAALVDNRSVQLAVLLATRAWLTIAAQAGLYPDASAGHSLGEYSHLVAIGALSAGAAVTLIDARGRAYDAGPRGAMAAIHPLSAEDTLASLAGTPDVWLACDNGPGQVVIGGEAGALESAIARIEEEWGAFATVIEPTIPMHTPRFAPAAVGLRPALATAPWARPRATWWSNVTGGPVADPTRATFVSLLTRHVSEPVRWRTLVDALLVAHPDAVVVEVGPRRVLSDLLRRARPGLTVYALDPLGSANPAATVAATLDALRLELARAVA